MIMSSFVFVRFYFSLKIRKLHLLKKAKIYRCTLVFFSTTNIHVLNVFSLIFFCSRQFYKKCNFKFPQMFRIILQMMVDNVSQERGSYCFNVYENTFKLSNHKYNLLSSKSEISIYHLSCQDFEIFTNANIQYFKRF